MARNGLSSRQRAFVREFLIDSNGTQAAIRAGYSPESAAESASENLRKSNIRRLVREGEKRKVARAELTADMVLREWMLIAFSSLADYRHKNGVVKIKKGRDPGALRAISSFKLKEKPGGSAKPEVELKLWDKPKALTVLSQHFGIIKPADLPPLETFLASLPSHVAEGLRAYIAQAVLAQGAIGERGSGEAKA